MTDDKLTDTIAKGICDDAFNRYKGGLKDGSLAEMEWMKDASGDDFGVDRFTARGRYLVRVEIAAVGLLAKNGPAMWLTITVDRGNEDCGIWERKWEREEELVDEYHEYAREFLYQQSRRV